MDVIAELERAERIERLKEQHNWSALLANLGLPVISSREIGTFAPGGFFRYPRVVCYRKDPETRQRYEHGTTIGWGYKRPSKRTPIKQPCIHQQWVAEEWETLAFKRCEDCGQYLSNDEVVSFHAVNLIRNFKEFSGPNPRLNPSPLWKDWKHTKIPWKVQEREGDGWEVLIYTAVETVVRFPRQSQLPQFDVSSAPAIEIEERRLNAAWPYVLSHPDFREYRAPYTKVRELRDRGFSIPQMARRLRVSERTINNRLVDVPVSKPSVSLLDARSKAGSVNWTLTASLRPKHRSAVLVRNTCSAYIHLPSEKEVYLHYRRWCGALGIYPASREIYERVKGGL